MVIWHVASLRVIRRCYRLRRHHMFFHNLPRTVINAHCTSFPRRDSDRYTELFPEIAPHQEYVLGPLQLLRGIILFMTSPTSEPSTPPGELLSCRNTITASVDLVLQPRSKPCKAVPKRKTLSHTVARIFQLPDMNSGSRKYGAWGHFSLLEGMCEHSIADATSPRF